MGESNSVNDSESRRSFVQKIAYAAPLVFTLKAEPAFASYGSGKPNQPEANNGVGKGVGPPPHGEPAQQKGNQRGNNGIGNGVDAQPPGNPPVNDGPGTGPGHPGNSHRGHGS